jgi:hypothetical protein
VGSLRCPRPGPHCPGPRGHRGDRRRLLLLPWLRAHLGHPERGCRAARHPGAPTAALLHLRGFRCRHGTAALSGGRGRDLPCPASCQRAARRLQPAHHGAGVCRPGPADRGGLGVAGLLIALRKFSWLPLGS